MNSTPPTQPRFGIQGPVLAFSDPWSPEASEAILRTGTGIPIASQDASASPEALLKALADLGADVYLHHVIPEDAGQMRMLRDLADAGIDVVLGNEYGNINGPFTEGYNRYDPPADLVREAAKSGILAGVLYDEPEHLQIHADQYRHDAYLPHLGSGEGGAEAAIAAIDDSVRGIVSDVRRAAEVDVPVLAEHVFPVFFHTLAAAGMTPAPKVMKESFSALQLGTALGAAKQYSRGLWTCVDLWGPDIGPWTTRAPGFPGHSPAEFASALRMAYLFAPDCLYVENIDVLVRHHGGGVFDDTEFGEVWREFRKDFVPRHPLTWSHREAVADIALVHAEDSDFGRGERPFGDRSAAAPESARSVFEAWNVLTHGSSPVGGSSLHIPGYDFPRHRLNGTPRSEFPLEAGSDTQSRMHGLFQPSRGVLAFDEHVRDEHLGDPDLVVVAGSRLPEETRGMLRRRAERGTTVVIAEWLAGGLRSADGWHVYQSLDDVHEVIEAHRGRSDEWTQRFGDVEVRVTAADAHGETLHFHVSGA